MHCGADQGPAPTSASGKGAVHGTYSALEAVANSPNMVHILTELT